MKHAISLLERERKSLQSIIAYHESLLTSRVVSDNQKAKERYAKITKQEEFDDIDRAIKILKVIAAS